jgi:DnaJ-class molecular chaperone
VAQKLVDYYAIMNVPVEVDLQGIENAYARLSAELAELAEVDEACNESLGRLNEAYGVLSRPEHRRAYDEVFLAARKAAERQQADRAERRHATIGWVLTGAIFAVVAVPLGVLAFIARGELSNAMSAVLGPLGA